MKHTKEPWEARRDPCHFGTLSSVYGHEHDRSVAEIGGMTWEEQEANTHRVVACVNALAGIADPEAFVAKVREVIAAWNNDEIGQIDGSLIEALENMLPQENPNG